MFVRRLPVRSGNAVSPQSTELTGIVFGSAQLESAWREQRHPTHRNGRRCALDIQEDIERLVVVEFPLHRLAALRGANIYNGSQCQRGRAMMAASRAKAAALVLRKAASGF